MKTKFKNGHFNVCYGGNTLYEKSTLQRMTKADLIELIECAQYNYENLLGERDYFQEMVSILTKCSGTQAPNLYINANDVLTIKRIEEEEK